MVEDRSHRSAGWIALVDKDIHAGELYKMKSAAFQRASPEHHQELTVCLHIADIQVNKSHHHSHIVRRGELRAGKGRR